MYRIWIDQDSVIYDLNTVWYGLHNNDYPAHIIRPEHITEWDTSKACKSAGCDADIYSYFNDPKLWSQGIAIGNSIEITKRLIKDVDLGILTTAVNAISATHKLEWLRNNFPHIKDIIITNGHLKHLVIGDILIDDGIHNLEGFKGISIVYSQPWNRLAGNYPRAENWTDVEYLIKKSIRLLEAGFKYKHIEYILRSEQMI